MIPQYNKDNLIECITKAGTIVNRYFKSADLAVKHKDKDQPVTQADLECSRFLEEALLKIIPNADICSEESPFKENNKDLLWLIDPIDGTAAFINGEKEFAISIGLAYRNSFILGAIHNPANGFLAVGDIESGIYEKQNLPPTASESHSLTISRTEAKKQIFADLERKGSPFLLYPLHSIAYKLALTACGVYNLTVSRKPKNSWDVAGGIALINAATGTVEPKVFAGPRCGLFSESIIAGKKNFIKIYKDFMEGEHSP